MLSHFSKIYNVSLQEEFLNSMKANDFRKAKRLLDKMEHPTTNKEFERLHVLSEAYRMYIDKFTEQIKVNYRRNNTDALDRLLGIYPLVR